jgi:hypothetical protein
MCFERRVLFAKQAGRLNFAVEGVSRSHVSLHMRCGDGVPCEIHIKDNNSTNGSFLYRVSMQSLLIASQDDNIYEREIAGGTATGGESRERRELGTDKRRDESFGAGRTEKRPRQGLTVGETPPLPTLLEKHLLPSDGWADLSGVAYLRVGPSLVLGLSSVAVANSINRASASGTARGPGFGLRDVVCRTERIFSDGELRLQGILPSLTPITRSRQNCHCSAHGLVLECRVGMLQWRVFMLPGCCI